MIRTVTAILITLGLGLTTAGAQVDSKRAPVSAPTAALINLNTATVPQLEALPGIGRAIAERIVEYRQKHGAFKRVEDLMNVRGVGEKSFLQLKPLVTVTPARSERAEQ